MGLLAFFGYAQQAKTKARGSVSEGAVESILSALAGDHVKLRDLAKKNTGYVWLCSTKNAFAVTQATPRLYAIGGTRRFKHRKLSKAELKHHRHPRLRAMTTADEPVEIVDHPILDLLSASWGGMDRYTRYMLYQQSLEIFGNSYWLIEKDPLGKGSGLTVMPAQEVEIRVDRDTRELTGYKWGQVEYPPDRVYHDKMPNLRDPFTGMGCLEAAFDSEELQRAVAQYLRATFRNFARPDHLIRLPEGTDKKQEREFFRQYMRQHVGDRQGRPLAVRGDEVKIEPLNFPPKDMGSLQIASMSRDEILSIFGVPVTAVQISKSRAEAEANEYAYAHNTIWPRVVSRDQAMTGKLIPMLLGRDGPNDDSRRLFFASDNPVPEDADRELQQRSTRLTSYLTTVNEERAEMGKEPVPWGNVPLAGLGIVPLGSAPEPDPDPEPNEPEPEPDDEAEESDESAKHAKRSKIYRRVVDDEKRLQQAAQKWLDRVAKEVNYNLSRSGKAVKDAGYEWFDRSKHARDLRDMTEPIIRGIISRGAVQAEYDIGGLLTLDVNNLEVENFIRGYTYRFAAKVSDTLAEDLRRNISSGMAEGESVRDIAKRLDPLFGPSRSERIARTETSRAATRGYRALLEQNPLTTEIVWNAQDDACEFCQAENGKVVGVQDSFHGKGETIEGPSGAQLKADYEDINGGDLHPNCRCDVQAVIPDSRDIAEFERNERARVLLGEALEVEDERAATTDEAYSSAEKRIDVLLGTEQGATYREAVSAWENSSAEAVERLAMGKNKYGKLLEAVVDRATIGTKTVWRGLPATTAGYKRAVESLVPGAKWTADRMLSATSKRSAAIEAAKGQRKSVLLKITPPGAKIRGMHIGAVSDDPRMAEVLLPKGATYEVVSAVEKAGRLEVTLRQTPPATKAEGPESESLAELLVGRVVSPEVIE